MRVGDDETPRRGRGFRVERTTRFELATLTLATPPPEDPDRSEA
jgi:hypothetical protein